MIVRVQGAWAWWLRVWRRWGASIAICGVVVVAVFAYALDRWQDDDIDEAQCKTLTKVVNAVDALARPAPSTGADLADLERIEAANAQRAEARRIVADVLACN